MWCDGFRGNGSTCTLCGAYSTSTVAVSENCVCRAGTYGSGTADCAVCPAGKYKPIDGSAECTGCGVGKYKLSPGPGECTYCAAGKYSVIVNASTDICSDCAAGFYSADNRTVCLECPANSNFDGVGTLLPPCKCNVGWTGTDGDCSVCVAGKYNHVNESVVCIICEAGKYAVPVNSYTNEYSAYNTTKCLLCGVNADSLAGSVNITSCICNAGWTGTDGVCIGCVAGKYKASPGPQACSLCAAGKFSAYLNSSTDTCTNCAARSYAVDNKTFCQSCPEKTYSAIGSDSIADCSCQAGWSGTISNCIGCVAGKYKASAGPQACSLCGAGKISLVLNSATDTCINCSAGSYWVNTNTSCLSCPQNSYSSIGSDSIAGCACNAGWSGSGGDCTGCVAGKYKAKNGSEACSDCGSYVADGSSACLPCASSSFASGNCAFCGPGEYSSPPIVRCVPCAAGSYAAPNRSECLTCPENSQSAVGSAAFEACLCNTGYSKGTTMSVQKELYLVCAFRYGCPYWNLCRWVNL